MFERQVDKAFEHTVQLAGIEYRSRFAIQGILAHQFVELLDIYRLTGKPELHLHLIGAQATQADRAAVKTQRCTQIGFEPSRQWFDPGFPASQVATAANCAVDRLGHGLSFREAFVTRPLEQPMQESTGACATGKTVNARTRRKRRDYFIHSKAFLGEVRLQGRGRLKPLTGFGAHQLVAVGDGQCRVAGDPPV